MNVLGNRLNSWKMLKWLSLAFILTILFDFLSKICYLDDAHLSSSQLSSLPSICHLNNTSLSSLWLLLLSSICHFNDITLQSFMLLLSIYHSMKFYSLLINLFSFISLILIILFHVIISNLMKLDYWKRNILSWIYNSNLF